MCLLQSGSIGQPHALHSIETSSHSVQWKAKTSSGLCRSFTNSFTHTHTHWTINFCCFEKVSVLLLWPDVYYHFELIAYQPNFSNLFFFLSRFAMHKISIFFYLLLFHGDSVITKPEIFFHFLFDEMKNLIYGEIIIRILESRVFFVCVKCVEICKWVQFSE